MDYRNHTQEVKFRLMLTYLPKHTFGANEVKVSVSLVFIYLNKGTFNCTESIC